MRPSSGHDPTAGATDTASDRFAPTTGSSAFVVAAPQRGGTRTTSATTPLAMNNQMISDSVHAVATVLMANSAQSSRSRASVSLTSLMALRAMIVMTAAPMP